MNPAPARRLPLFLVAVAVGALLALAPAQVSAQDPDGTDTGTTAGADTGTTSADTGDAAGADTGTDAGTGTAGTTPGADTGGELPPTSGPSDMGDTGAATDTGSALGGVKAERDYTVLNERMWRPAMVGMSGQFNYIFAAPHLNGIDTTQKDHVSLSVRLEIATTNADEQFNVPGVGDERLYMDGAVARLVPEITWGALETFDLGLRIGLAVRGGTSYVVNQNDVLLNKDGGEAGISDITLVARWRIYTGDEGNIFRGLIAVAEVKFPSQMTNGLISSGAPDLTGMFTAAFQVTPDIRVHAGIGFTYLGPGFTEDSQNQYFLDKRRDMSNIWFLGASGHFNLSSLLNLDLGETTHLVGSVEYHAYGAALLGAVGAINATLHDAVLTLGLQLGEFGLTGAAGITLGGTGDVDVIGSITFTYFAF